MKITVKRRTWFLEILTPVHLNFNGKEVASLVGRQDEVIQIPKEEGYLKYNRFLDRSAGVHVKAGDVVKIKETALNKIVNILFLSTFIYLLAMSSHVLRTGYPNFNEFSTILGTILISALLLLIVISYFFSSYRLVVENP